MKHRGVFVVNFRALVLILLIRHNHSLASEYETINNNCLSCNLNDVLEKPVLKSELNLTIVNRNQINNKTFKIIEENVVKSDFDVLKLWNEFPKVIVPRNSENQICRKHSEKFVESLENLELWAVKMFDASAKLPSGILNGNLNQYGDFDQCLAISSPKDNSDDVISGKYCLAEIDLRFKHDHALHKFDSAIHAHDMISSNLDDPGHRIPRFSSIHWGLCMPASCSGSDLEQELNTSYSDVVLRVRILDKMCYTDANPKPKNSSFGHAFTLVFFSSIIFLTILGTSVDNSNRTSKLLKCINAFSLKKNWKKLTDVTDNNKTIGCLHGIRFLNALALIFSHKSMATFYYPFINRTHQSEMLSQPWSVIGRTAIIYTDSFLLLSGLLTTYGMLGDLKKTGKINFFQKVSTRLFRMGPNLLAVILFCTYILPDINRGPQWNLVVKEHSEICKSNMWKSFLLIHNYFGFETMCLTHTHQVGIDMQLFLITPLIVLLLWKRPKQGFWIFLTLAVLSTLLRYYVAVTMKLGHMVHYGMPVKRFFETSNYSYILPTHRLTIYLLGVFLGYTIKMGDIKLRFNKHVVNFCWLLALTMCTLAMAGPYKMGSKDYVYNEHDGALYGALSPWVWGSFLTWGILSLTNGHWKPLNDVLSWKGFAIFSNISYGVYLTQFPIFFYNVGIMRSPSYYYPTIMLELPEMLAVVLVSTILALLVEYPFQEIGKIVWSRQNTDRDTKTDKKLM